jgi:hypothetical protein
MPTSKKPIAKRPQAKSSAREILTELQELNEQVAEMKQRLAVIAPRSKMAKFWGSFFSGIAKGFGFLLGTTVVAALLFFAMRTLLDTNVVQEWVGSMFKDIVVESIPSQDDILQNLPFDQFQE